MMLHAAHKFAGHASVLCCIRMEKYVANLTGQHRSNTPRPTSTPPTFTLVLSLSFLQLQRRSFPLPLSLFLSFLCSLEFLSIKFMHILCVCVQTARKPNECICPSRPSLWHPFNHPLNHSPNHFAKPLRNASNRSMHC